MYNQSIWMGNSFTCTLPCSRFFFLQKEREGGSLEQRLSLNMFVVQKEYFLFWPFEGKRKIVTYKSADNLIKSQESQYFRECSLVSNGFFMLFRTIFLAVVQSYHVDELVDDEYVFVCQITRLITDNVEQRRSEIQNYLII